jgi:hypothetical protein
MGIRQKCSCGLQLPGCRTPSKSRKRYFFGIWIDTVSSFASPATTLGIGLIPQARFWAVAAYGVHEDTASSINLHARPINDAQSEGTIGQRVPDREGCPPLLGYHKQVARKDSLPRGWR